MTLRCKPVKFNANAIKAVFHGSVTSIGKINTFEILKLLAPYTTVNVAYIDYSNYYEQEDDIRDGDSE